METHVIINKTHNECKLDTKEETHEEECNDEHDSDSESEDDRCLLWRMFDGWIWHVCHVRWEFNKDKKNALW